MKRLTFSILWIIFAAAFAIAQTPQTIQTGFTIERELGETEKHIYEINLTKGQMLNFVVEQRGIDVMLRVTTADGKFVDRVDTPNGREGDEPFKIVSLEGGRYRVEVSRFSEETARTTGKYFVKMVEIRKATDAEIKTAWLKAELVKIVAEDNRSGSYPDALRRFYSNRALLTNPFGYVSDTAEWIELTTQNPVKLTNGYSAEAEFSGVRLEDFGDAAVLSVRRDMHVKKPSADEDYTTIQQIGYVFKRTNGDGRTDISVFRDGVWYWLGSSNGNFNTVQFGLADDIPQPADFSGDGRAEIAVYRNGTWWTLNLTNNQINTIEFGISTDKPVAADYDGDGKSDIAIFRPSDGSWWYLQSSNLQYSVSRFGVSTDKPVQGDYTGDGKADIAIFRPSTGEWFIQRSEDNSFFSFPFGAVGDIPTPGDYDGDGQVDAAIFRPSNSTWFLKQSTAGIGIVTFGITGDVPVPNAFVP